jgi:phosphate transport system substrate-binding protein
VFKYFQKILTFCLILAFFSPLISKASNLPNLKSRNYITMVGSSTIYPFATTIAEEFGRNTKFRTPIVESIGTGGGLKLFCSGLGANYPDFSNASRKIEASEIKRCAQNSVTDPLEIKIGYDGIVLSNSTNGSNYNLTKKDVFLALAQKIPQNGILVDNYYQKWSEVNPQLPNNNIVVYGEPSTSGTRDAFSELVMIEACINQPEFITAYGDEKERKKRCQMIRNDGKFIESANPNLIIQKLRNNQDAIGIFGYSFLAENINVIKAAVINKVNPSFQTILDGSYTISRPLFIYAKKQHFYLIAGMKEFIKEIINKETIGSDGYLIEKGLIPMTDKELDKVRENVLKIN